MFNLQRFKDAAASDFNHVVSGMKSTIAKCGTAAGAVLVSGAASAAPVTFDTSEIVANIGIFVAGGVLILTAFVVGKWTLRAFGVIK